MLKDEVNDVKRIGYKKLEIIKAVLHV